MAVYIIAQLQIHDDSWVADYVPAVHAMVEAAGGRYLVQTPEAVHIEGDAEQPSITVIIEFPNKEAAQGFYESAEYKAQMGARLAGSTGDLRLVDGVED